MVTAGIGCDFTWIASEIRFNPVIPGQMIDKMGTIIEIVQEHGGRALFDADGAALKARVEGGARLARPG
ncbi:hypothetical protein [Methanosphaerula subterraneus]|uniref:hypothetical protein n=1 Tax=Methanosphaerula subterraneus TaxID=3350244 RepID=UPI003F868FDD